MTEQSTGQRLVMLETLATPGSDATVQDRIDAAWEVLLDATYYGPDEGTQQLLPPARKVIELVAAHPETLPEDPFAQVDAKIVIATWGVFSALAGDKPVTDKTRAISVRNLCKVMAGLGGASFTIARADSPTAPRDATNKAYQAFVAALSLCNPEASGIFAVPSPPFTHNRHYVDPRNGTTDHHLLGFAPGVTCVPLFVAERNRPFMDSLLRVIPILLDDLVITSLQHTPAQQLNKENPKERTIDRIRWFINLMAKTMAAKGQAAEVHEKLVNEAATQLGNRIKTAA